MKRLALIILLLLLAVSGQGPLQSNANQLLTTKKTAARVDSTALKPTTQRTQPELKVVRGTSGFWRIGQDTDGVWWFVSPTNSREFMNTVTTVQPFQRGRDDVGPSYISNDWDGGATPKGDVDHWAVATLGKVRDAGFKGLGAWCHPVFHKMDVPMTRDLNVWMWADPASKRFYSPNWPIAAEGAIKTQCEPLKGNHNLVGYYTDNELDWGDGGSGPSVYFDTLAPTDPNRIEVIRVIQTVWSTLDQFNADWGTKLSDWKQLGTWDRLPKDTQPKAYSRLFSAWLNHLAGDYFRLTTSLVHKYDPNHLVLGVRFRGFAPEEVVKAANGYTDAQSLNYYVSDALLDLDQFKMMYQAGNQPVIISEYSFHSLDGRSGNRNAVGFNAQVLDQRARADGYRLMTTHLARIPWVIGADWFQWMDEPPSGRSSDGEDVNFGIVDIDDRPYVGLVNSIRSTTPLLNGMHETSANDEQQDIWRESFATKPIAHVPFLPKGITINGELSDWPAQAKVQGIRHSQAVGLERSPLPMPNVYLGWNAEGLFIGMEVYDNDIEGAPAKAWWWTKDNVELWISTKPVSNDQNTYDVNCSQFFYVPNDNTASNGVSGIVGQWHREGDALTDNIIPHTAIRQTMSNVPG